MENTSMKYYLLLILLLSASSCGSIQKKLTLKGIEQIEHAKMRKIPVSSNQEASKVIRNQHEYLKLLFKQSFDPYFNTPKWSDKCLGQNRIGDMRESEKEISFTAQLMLREYQPGFCTLHEGASMFHVVYLYCDSAQDVLEIKVPSSSQHPILPENLCP